MILALKESVKGGVCANDNILPIQSRNKVMFKGFVLSRRLSHSDRLVVSVAPMSSLSSLVASTLRKSIKPQSTAESLPPPGPASLNYDKYVVTFLAAKYAWKNAESMITNDSYSVELFVNTRPTELAKLLKYVDVGTVIDVEGEVEGIGEEIIPVAQLQGVGVPPLGVRWFDTQIEVHNLKSKKYFYQQRMR